MRLELVSGVPPLVAPLERIFLNIVAGVLTYGNFPHTAGNILIPHPQIKSTSDPDWIARAFFPPCVLVPFGGLTWI